MRRFLASRVDEDKVYITDQEAQHLSRVLRMTKGERVLALDGKGKLYRTRILSIEDNEVIAQIEAELAMEEEDKAEITIAQGLLKGEKMDFVVQKLTELGVTSFVPLTLERSIVKLDEKKKTQRQERWQKIVLSAVKQCGRTDIPEIKKVQSLSELLKSADDYDLILFPWEEEQEKSFKDVLEENSQAKKVLCILGPEGGMTAGEMLRAVEAGGKVVTLGKRILRAETASIATMAVLQYELGDLN